MPDILICGLSNAAVERIDAEATTQGPSRNEFLRRRLEQGAPGPATPAITPEDWKRSAQVFSDLTDPDVMDDAWR
ncbi:MAG: hypothetical protein WDA07_12325 [Leucobacter sp.]